MPEHKTMDEILASIAEQLQELVRQQDEVIKYLTGSTREELRTAQRLASQYVEQQKCEDVFL